MKLVIRWQSLSLLQCVTIAVILGKLFQASCIKYHARGIEGRHIQSPKIIHYIALNYHWAVRVQLENG